MSALPARPTDSSMRMSRIRYGDGVPLEPQDESLETVTDRLLGAPPAPGASAACMNSAFVQKFLSRFSHELKRMAEAKLVEAEVVSCAPGRPVVLDLSTGTGVLDDAEVAGAQAAVGRRLWVSPIEAGGGQAVYSLKAARGRRSLSTIESLWAGGVGVEGNVIEQMPPDGWVVDIDGVKAGLPAEEAGEAAPLHTPLKFAILHYDPLTSCVVLSRKNHAARERRISDRRARARLNLGDIVSGRVTSIAQTSASIDLGGVIAELSGDDAGFGQAKENLSALHSGQILSVMVIDVTEGRIVVGLKQLSPDPWVFLKKKLQPGTRVEAVIRKILPDRLGVELSDQVSGEIPWKDAGWQIFDAADLPAFFSAGERVEAVCQSVMREQGRVVLSIKALRPDPLPDIQRRFSPGVRVEARLISCSPARALVLTDDGFYGEILAEDLVWSGPMSPAHFFSWPPSGATSSRRAAVEVLSVNPSTRLIRFGVKQLKPDPFVTLIKEIEIGKVYEGRVVKLIAVGALLEIRKGLVGLLRKSDYASAETPPAEGQSLQVMVMNIQSQQRRILLSRQSVVDLEERREMQPYLSPATEERKVRMKDVLQGDVFKKFFDKK